MEGTVTSYNSGTGVLVANITTVQGSGTQTSWEVNLAGASGGDGTSGSAGSAGSSGTTGTSGSSGSTGSAGSAGSTGSAGSAGTSGTDGLDGTSGTSGTSASGGTSFDYRSLATTSYIVTSPSNYALAHPDGTSLGSSNPTIRIKAEQTVCFNLEGVSSSHPFAIRSASGDANDYSTGLVHFDGTSTFVTGASAQDKTSGYLFWTPPQALGGTTYKYQCANHSSMIGDIEISSIQGGATGLQNRVSTSATTSSIADDASDDISVTGYNSYALLSVQTDRAAWVTVYSSSSARSSDSSRTINTDPDPGSGVIAEVVTDAAATQIITPAAVGFNESTSDSGTIYMKVVNLSGSTSTVQVTLTVLKLEN